MNTPWAARDAARSARSCRVIFTPCYLRYPTSDDNGPEQLLDNSNPAS